MAAVAVAVAAAAAAAALSTRAFRTCRAFRTSSSPLCSMEGAAAAAAGAAAAASPHLQSSSHSSTHPLWMHQASPAHARPGRPSRPAHGRYLRAPALGRRPLRCPALWATLRGRERAPPHALLQVLGQGRPTRSQRWARWQARTARRRGTPGGRGRATSEAAGAPRWPVGVARFADTLSCNRGEKNARTRISALLFRLCLTTTIARRPSADGCWL